MPKDYNDTLNLPKTDFPMRAGLAKTEPTFLHDWEENSLYDKLMKKNDGKPSYIVHDGPPYANGSIHMGHALNHILKDFIVKYKNMSGFKAPFVPGWDTHGLPTELKARKKAGVDSSSNISDMELRSLCQEFVMDYINDQRNQFKRLGILADWEHPYITLQKEYEAKQIEVFAKMACDGHIYRGLKPVYWCPDCKTALAEAEIEYSNDVCYSIYVKFRLKNDNGKLSQLGIDLNKIYFVIWTTTAWTLPGNVAICVGPEFVYNVVKFDDEYYIMAAELCSSAMSKAGKENYEVVASLKGIELEFMTAEHPFLDRESLVIVGDHVTLESGTGCVHTAPGHGVEDFDVCQNYEQVDVVVPVNDEGILTEGAGQFEGLSTQKAGKPIAQHLESIGALFATEKIEHQYPHCWRCKNPVIFRATEQWFCSIDDFKEKALKEIQKVRWIPTWGQDRISSMVRDRKDWCISRQRKWGIPLPIFFCKECGEPLIDKDAMLDVADMFRKEGSDSWFIKPVDEILPEGIKCSKCGSSSFRKETDIMDVWFDSGVSHAAVCGQRRDLSCPADLYFEGADQYRGWFQSSLLTSVATTGKAPYKTVVSHGWVVDGEGKKQSKSLGNGMDPQEIVNQYGADILRLWVASSDYHVDVRLSQEILKQLSEAYRKIRNTARYILGNLYDFNPNENMMPLDKVLPVDKWALDKLNKLIDKVKESYENFEFHQVYHNIRKFCVVDMSNFYLDILKDRLYVESANSSSRRAAQTTIYLILNAMTRLLAPILAFTAEEIWRYIPHNCSEEVGSVLFNSMPEKLALNVTNDFIDSWDKIGEIRIDVQKALELARKDKVIGSSLEAKVTLHCTDELYDFVLSVKDDLKDVFIVSQVDLEKNNSGNYVAENVKGLSVTISRANGKKCERCWSFSDTVGKNSNNENICSRCADILNK